jgi:hypothetical protein
MNMGRGANAVDRFLHLAMAAIAALNRIGGRRQQPVIQKGERLIDIGREERLQGFSDLGKALDTLAQASQLDQGRGRATAPVKEPIRFASSIISRKARRCGRPRVMRCTVSRSLGVKWRWTNR